MATAQEQKYLSRAPESERASLEAFIAKRGALIWEAKTLQDLARIWQDILRENSVQYCDTFNLEDTRVYAPLLTQGERPLPVLKDWPNRDPGEIIAWTETEVLFADIFSMECFIVPRMSQSEMRALVKRAAEIKGAWSAIRQKDVRVFMPDGNIFDGGFLFAGVIVDAAEWAMSVIQIWQDNQDAMHENLCDEMAHD